MRGEDRAVGWGSEPSGGPKRTGALRGQGELGQSSPVWPLVQPRWEGGAQHCSQSPLPLHPPHREGAPQAAAGLAGAGSCILS